MKYPTLTLNNHSGLRAMTLALAAALMLLGAVPGLAAVEAAAETSSESAPQAKASKKAVVNINQASAGELQLLPRVGPSIAQRIVEFREANGAFERLEDLMLVRGIGEKTFLLLRPHLSLSGPTTLSSKVRPPRSSSEGTEG